MGAQNRLLLKIVGTALVGPFCLPPLIFGSYLGICWVRIHTTSLYYVEYPFFLGASISTAVAALSIFLTLHGVWRRSYYGVVFVPPVLFGLVFMIQIPDLIPYLNRSMVADSDFLSTPERSCSLGTNRITGFRTVRRSFRTPWRKAPWFGEIRYSRCLLKVPIPNTVRDCPIRWLFSQTLPGRGFATFPQGQGLFTTPPQRISRDFGSR